MRGLLFILLCIGFTLQAAPSATDNTRELDRIWKEIENEHNQSEKQITGIEKSIEEKVQNIQNRNDDILSVIQKEKDWIDKWLTAIGYLLTLIPLFAFGGFKYLQGQVNRGVKDINAAVSNAEKEAKRTLEELKRNSSSELENVKSNYVDEFSKMKDELNTLKHKAQSDAKEIESKLDSFTAETVGEDSELPKEITEVQNDVKATPLEKAQAKAYQLQNEKKFDEAIEQWKKIIIEFSLSDEEQFTARFNIAYISQQFYKVKKDPVLINTSIEMYNTINSMFEETDGTNNNLGNAYGDFAMEQEGLESEKLFNLSFEKYDKAIELNPSFYLAYNNWGTTLGAFAKIENNEKAEEVLRTSIEKFKKAINIKPDYGSAFYNWTAALLELYYLVPKDEKDAVLNDAYKKATTAIEMGEQHYNLACVYALKSNKDEAFRILKISLEKKETTSLHVRTDIDWEAYWEDSDFLALLKEFE